MNLRILTERFPDPAERWAYINIVYRQDTQNDPGHLAPFLTAVVLCGLVFLAVVGGVG